MSRGGGARVPIPVCKDHIKDAIDRWNLGENTVVEPVRRIWTPWTIPTTWGQRVANVFSHDQRGYAI